MQNTTEIAGQAERFPLVRELRSASEALLRGELSDASMHLVGKVLIPALAALALFIVAYFFAKLVSRWVSAAICARVDNTLGRFMGKLAFYSTLTVVGLSILQTAGVSVAGFAAVLAAAGFAIGLAFQGTLSNFASGVLLLVFRPFKVGDFILAAGIAGKVNEIDLFTTTFDTPDNRRLTVPNSAIAGTTIENVSFHKHRRVDVTVGIAYTAGLDETRAVLTRCVESLQDKMIEGENRGYQILLSNLGPSSVDWTVRFWAESKMFFQVKEALTSAIKRGLDDAGLEIPFQQMQIHVSERPTAAPTALSSASILPKPKLSGEEKSSTRIRPRARGASPIS